MPMLNPGPADLPDRLQSLLAGRYTLDRELGRGGMATVYLAHDLKHRRRVALKVVHPHLAYALGADRFLREIETAAALAHPHILPLFDSGADTREASGEGILWYTMPYVEGEALRARLTRERQLPVADAVRIAAEVADALAYAHEHGVIHRDVKPENILLSGSHALVADFGVARALTAAAGERLTQTGIAVGTPAYMSPEQACADPDADPRSDLYSLGCVLYEMLAGEPPFTGPTTQAVIARRLTDPVPSVRAVRPTVPEWLDRAVRTALAPIPADRFATAARFAQCLLAPSATDAPPTPQAERSIAVLPFTNMSADPEAEYFADGVAEEILNALTQVQPLHVAARTSAFAFKGRNEDIGEIGRKLKVATVLEGSVRKAGNRLRITAQLVDVANGYHLWSQRYDREMADVFAIQDDIAQSIVLALRLVLSEQERRAIQRPRVDVEAYEYYLRGRQLFHQFRRKSLDFARQMFAKAIAIEPGFARAYAGIADCHSFLYEKHDPSEANLEQADAASRKALELDPESAEAHAARGHALSLRSRFDEARHAFAASIRIAPKLFEAHYFFGRACVLQGRREEAVRHFEEAGRVRPEDFQSRSLLGSVLEGLGRTEEAKATHQEALRLIEQHLELYPDDARALYFGAGALVQRGELERALEWAQRALELDPDDSAILYNVACVYAAAGEVERALDCLERAVRQGMRNRAWFQNDPDLDSLRNHPRFVALFASL